MSGPDGEYRVELTGFSPGERVTGAVRTWDCNHRRPIQQRRDQVDARYGYDEGTVSLIAGTEHRVDRSLVDFAILHLTVIGTDGTPSAGTCVLANGALNGDGGTTDDFGRITLTGLDPHPGMTLIGGFDDCVDREPVFPFWTRPLSLRPGTQTMVTKLTESDHPG